MSKSPGYSGTPLVRKLGIAENMRVALRHAPGDYEALVDPLPAGVELVTRATSSTDLVHLFADRKAVLLKELPLLRKAMRPQIVVWVSWPKKASGVATDVTEDTVREVALPLGFVDVKVCAVTEVWSGLKLVVRKELRGAAHAARRSG